MKKIDVKFRNPYNNCILSKIIFHQYSWALKLGFGKPHTENGQFVLPLD